VAFTSPIQES